MILEELGRNPPDVTLDHIVKDLLSFFNGFECLHEAKRMIEKKCAIKKEPEHKCWSEDYIKQAWEETIKQDIKSSTRRHWARVIILQVIKSFVCDMCKQNATQKNRHDTTDEQGCDMRRNPEDGSSQSKAELETVGAAGGVEQMFAEGKKISEVSKLSEDSGVASGSQPSASSTDVAPSPTKINPVANSSNSKTKNAALMNRNEDTLVKNYDQQKDVDDYELYVADMLDAEDETWEDGLWSTDDINQACGKAESNKENSEDRSFQGNDELKTETAAKGVNQLSGGEQPVSNYGQTNIGSQGGTGTQFPSGIQDTANYSGAVSSQSGANVSVAPSYDENNMEIVDQCNYICIPLSKFCSESTTESPYENTNADMNADTNYNYKLIDQFPSDTQHCMYRKKSYVMLYDTAKKNAKWVYEILNKSTVPYHYKKVTFRKDNNIDDDKQALNSTKGFKDKDYVRGHLAAAANHMWCQEAYNDTYLISNMTPQIKSINNGIWKTLEYYCRNIIYNDDRVRNVHVYTGPLYLNNEGLTMEEKAVPTHYFKVVIVENVNGKAKVECYLVENKEKESETTDNISTDNQEKKKRENIRLKNYIVDIEEIEKKSGLPFTHKIDSNKVTVKKTLTCTGENERKHATTEVHVSI